MVKELKHLDASAFAESRAFKSNLMVQRDQAPQRERISHGQRLLDEIETLKRFEERLQERRDAEDLPAAAGLTIAVQLSPKGLVDPATLGWKAEGIEVLNVAFASDHDLVVLYVPEGKLSAFEKRITQYMLEDSKSGKPRNAALVNAVQSFRKAAFAEMWTDGLEAPAAAVPTWFQLWLRVKNNNPEATRRDFWQFAQRLEITVEQGYVPFPGRIVVAVHATRAELEKAIALLDVVAEIRSVQPTAEFFLSDLTPADQVQWARNLQVRLQHPSTNDGPYITLFDTGVVQAHPLIQSSLDLHDMHAADPTWSKADSHGHGTEMAGMILHGSLVEPLANSEQYSVPHRIESVNIFPPSGQTPYHLYGKVTEMAVSVVENAQSNRRRTFAMMTTCTEASTGQPSEWSATVDRLAAGASGTLKTDFEVRRTRRLFVLSAGNVSWDKWSDYPNINTLSGVESPAQAWNALTVGAYTDLTYIDEGKWPSLRCIATQGSLSPSSTTSLLWSRNWPFKPDVVSEGGNGSFDHTVPLVGPDSLRMLTTYYDLSKAMFTQTGETSAAAAEVSRLCAHISAKYPHYWPETIRALVVHGARYTRAMRALLPVVPVRADKEGLLRRFGHGAINHENSLSSQSRRPTLVIQGELNPYRKDKGEIKLNELNLHALPWPKDALQALQGSLVEMRVTLSYFIDPNPSRRGWQSKFRYQSHGLRFAVQGATETPEVFGQRINKIEREEAALAGAETIENMSDPDSSGWMFGPMLRARGSLHSDVWRGTGAELAQKSHLAVFPVGGWWKDWKEADQSAAVVRYALIVSLEVVSEIDIDLYTPIQTQVNVPIQVTIPVA
ncbi:MAG: S8 family peptidase [Cytophagaceae bacterium]|nr:MAG: S8 family peptidase [Cytophagaceae bacterium]